MSKSVNKQAASEPYYSFNAAKTGEARLKTHRTKKDALKAALQLAAGKGNSAVFGSRNKPGYHIVGLEQHSSDWINAAFSRAGIEAHGQTQHQPDHYYVYCNTEGRKVSGTDTTDYNEAEQNQDNHIVQYPTHDPTIITVQS
jgi:hypothetical protein